MNFAKKNDFIVKNKKDEYFPKDLELFKIHCPNSKIHLDLKLLNSFNRSRIHGFILGELLNKVSPEDILKNRGIESEEVIPVILNTVDEIKALFEGTNVDMGDLSDDALSNFIGLKKEDIVPFVEFMDYLYSLAPESVDTIEEVETIIVESGIPVNGTIEELALLLVGKTKEEILNMLTFAEVYYSTFPKKENEQQAETTDLGAKGSGFVSSETDGSTTGDKISNGVPESSGDVQEKGNNVDGTTSTGENLSENKSEHIAGTGEGISRISEDGKTSEGGSINSNDSDELPLTQELEEKAKELEEKEEELTDKEFELEEKEESLEEKAQELEDKEKELSVKESELNKASSKKKEVKPRNSRK